MLFSRKVSKNLARMQNRTTYKLGTKSKSKLIGPFHLLFERLSLESLQTQKVWSDPPLRSAQCPVYILSRSGFGHRRLNTTWTRVLLQSYYNMNLEPSLSKLFQFVMVDISNWKEKRNYTFFSSIRSWDESPTIFYLPWTSTLSKKDAPFGE